MDTLTWLVLANAAVWLGIGGYLAFLAIQQHRLAVRLSQWEILRHE
ncbi:MAG: CcmD family protein [Desulfovibrionaceae bacterium]|nr:CcmD family protein [Desulfovibrionaceae bacterium]